jgi:hypothetical protein
MSKIGLVCIYIVVKNVANPNFKLGSFTWLALGYWQLPVPVYRVPIHPKFLSRIWCMFVCTVSPWLKSLNRSHKAIMNSWGAN